MVESFNDLPLPPFANRIGGGNPHAVGMGFLVLFKQLGLVPVQSILDLGCGIGRIAFYLRDQCKDYVGVDIHAPSLVWCAQNLPQNMPDVHMAFISPDAWAGSMAWNKGHFDLTIALSLFTHTDPKTTTEYFHRVYSNLKPGGYFFFSFFNSLLSSPKASRQFPHKYVDSSGLSCQCVRAAWNMQNDVAYSASDLTRLFDGIGFKTAGYIEGNWSGLHPNMDLMHQDMILLRKP